MGCFGGTFPSPNDMVQIFLKTLKKTRGANDEIKRFHLISNVKGRLEVLKNIFFYFTSDCTHNTISQWWTQPPMGLCGHFDFFIKRNFWKIFLQHVPLNIYNPPINYMICVNFFLINVKFLKVYKFSQILHFILKNDHNFKSC